ncbi:MAG TPA: hypothetical protein VEU08_01715 [Vicinamibacterales bacterium]|nr:hypothetical protein [Vicinamibacterales bacterium]
MRVRAAAAALSAAALFTGATGAAPPRRPNLEGIWNGATLTPLQRPDGFRDRARFTPAEAAEYLRTSPERIARRLPTDTDRLTQADLDTASIEIESFSLDGLRTSLIVDPPDGMLPALVPAARARIASRPKRSFDDPETMSVGERCLVAMFGLGGSSASPPMLPSEVLPWFYQIVQTDDSVLIFTEWIHDARVVRINGAHPPPSIRKWLGDSIGRYEGDTLVVDTTNFRSETHNVDSSPLMHVVERFTRMDAKTLRYRVTVEDPDTWAAAWTAEWPFHASGARLFAAECHEGNYAIENFMRGARAEERRGR